jgi:hypothetical protein
MNLKYYLLFLILTLLGCAKKQELVQGEGPVATNPVDNSSEFLNLFKDLDPTSLHIYPPSWDKSGETSSPLNGEIIDVHKYSYVNDKNIFINIEACRKGQTSIYAVGKFEFNASTLALLIRQHSQYSESIIQLVFWDRKTRTITEGMDLADSFGDEGWYFDMESWINRDRDSDLEIVTRIKDSNYDSELDKRTVTDSLVRHVWHLTAFIQSNINKNDTTLYPLKRWE